MTAIVDHLQLEAQIGGYEAAERRYDLLSMFYDATAALIGCHFFRNASECLIIQMRI